MELVKKAFDFAREAHKGQKRKYTGEPYFNHPVEVAKIVKGVFHTEDMIAAALLHDVVEDCNVAFIEIKEKFGPAVELLVWWLSDPEGLPGNRAARKAALCERWKSAPDDAKTVKVADIISNSPSIFANDPNFSKVYFREVHALLPSLEGADRTLLHIARKQLEEYSGIIHS